MDKEKIKYHIRGLLEAIGEDPEREGLIETPARVADMIEEVLEGTAYTNHDIAQMFGKTFGTENSGAQETVVMKDISVFSYCEHVRYDGKCRVYPARQGAWAEQDSADM